MILLESFDGSEDMTDFITTDVDAFQNTSPVVLVPLLDHIQYPQTGMVPCD